MRPKSCDLNACIVLHRVASKLPDFQLNTATANLAELNNLGL